MDKISELEWCREMPVGKWTKASSNEWVNFKKEREGGNEEVISHSKYAMDVTE